MSFNRHKVPSLYFQYAFGLILIALLATSCRNSQENGNQHKEAAPVTASVGTETHLAKDFRLVAGESVGDFRLGQEMEGSGLFDRFGMADSSDAATCKSWTMWFPEKGQEVGVYAACDSALDMKKSIQLIRLAGIAFLTDKELTEKSTVQHVKRFYPAALEDEFSAPGGGKVVLYDAVDSGIAFEMAADSIRSVIIHPPGKKLSEYHLPFLSDPAP